MLFAVAALLIIIGLISYMTSEWEPASPGNPTTTLPPKNPSGEDAEPLAAVGMIQGLEIRDIGLPAQVTVSEDKLYVVDAYATSGVIKVFATTGAFLYSFGDISHEELTYVVDIATDYQGNVIVLDASSAVFVYSPEGIVQKRLDLGSNERPDLAWARIVQPVGEDYYVLSLNKLYRFNNDGLLMSTYPSAQDSYSLGTAPSEFYLGPSGLAVDTDALWISDSVNGRVLRLGASGQFDKEVALPNKDAIAPYPTSLQIDHVGNLLVVDAARQVLLKISQEGTVLGESRLNTSALLDNVDDVYTLALAGDGKLYVCDSRLGRVDVWDLTTKPSKTATLISAKARFLFPTAVAVGPAGVFILSGESRMGYDLEYRIYFSDFSGLNVQPFASTWKDAPLHGPTKLLLSNSELYVLDKDRVLVYTLDGKEVRSIGENIADWGGFGFVDMFGISTGPQGLAIDSANQLWVADTNRQRLVVFDPFGMFVREVPLGESVWPQAITFSPDGSLLVLNSYEGQVLRIDPSGKMLATYSSAGSGDGQLAVIAEMNRFDGPRDLVIDSEGSIYVVDTYNSRIVVFSSQGSYEGASGSFGSAMGKVYLPSSLTYLSSNDTFYLADTYNHRVQMLKLR